MELDREEAEEAAFYVGDFVREAVAADDRPTTRRRRPWRGVVVDVHVGGGPKPYKVAWFGMNYTGECSGGQLRPDAPRPASAKHRLRCDLMRMRERLIKEFVRLKSGCPTAAEAAQKYKDSIKPPASHRSVCWLCIKPIGNGAVAFGDYGHAHDACCREREEFMRLAIGYGLKEATQEFKKNAPTEPDA